MSWMMSMYFKLRVVLSFSLLVVSSQSFATGLNFWESSATNSALASANGARAIDASILATSPSSMTQLEQTQLTANLTRYQIKTDYDILSFQSQYTKLGLIPAAFFVKPLSPNWYFGLAIYSRTAADITIPKITIFFPKTRVHPVVVSFAPSMAYKIGDLSLGLTLEYQYADYLLEQNQCTILGRCNLKEIEGNTKGFSGGISATWQINDTVALSLNHTIPSQFDDHNINLDLPSITHAYASIKLLNNLYWHNGYSLSRWKNKQIKYTEYSDFIGLLKGSRNSQRFASSFEYQINKWAFMGGISFDEAVDPLGGNDIRYRLGISHQFNDKFKFDLAGFSEKYAHKFHQSTIGNVDVKNKGYGISFGVTFQS